MNDTSDKYANFSHDELVAEINCLKKHKKYGLVWEHKTEKVIEDFETQQPYLEEVTDKRIEDAPGEPTNLIIEGDNFEALSILNYAHAGKVDVIYIDPPYNTGNKDFIYNDYYVDSEDEFRHSKWLSFMEPRLRLARILLKDDGVLLISINDIEHASLIMLCDEIFGKESFVCDFIWAKNSGNNNSIAVSQKTEYIVTYVKIKDAINNSYFSQTKGSFNQIKKIIEECKEKKLSTSRTQELLRELYKNDPNISGGTKQYKYVDDNYEVFRVSDLGNPSSTAWNNPEYTYNLINPKTGSICTRPKRGWLYKKKDMDEKIRNNLIYFDSKVPGLKRYLNAVETENLSSLIINNDLGNRDLEKVFNKNEVFPHPKPVSLIKDFMRSYPKHDSVVLDFFAGSGTTGQAVLELNKEDGGHRQFILCTNNGDKGPDSVKIAEDITYPRVKTVITGERQDGSKYSDGIPANLRYYKINHREKKPSIDANRQDMAAYMEDIIQVKENAYKQLEVNEDFAIYESNEKYVGLVFEPFLLEEVITDLKERNEEKRPVKLYVFSYSRDAFEDDYGADFEIEFVAMPEGLLKTYAHIVEEQKKEDL